PAAPGRAESAPGALRPPQRRPRRKTGLPPAQQRQEQPAQPAHAPAPAEAARWRRPACAARTARPAPISAAPPAAARPWSAIPRLPIHEVDRAWGTTLLDCAAVIN